MDEKNEFVTTWKKAWSFFIGITGMMLLLTIFFMFLSGILTWYGINYVNLTERNTMLHPLFNNFGTEYVIVYDVFVSAIMIAFYKLIFFLNKKTLAKKNIDIRIICTIPMMLLYIFAFLNFLNDFGFAFHVGVFQNITEVLKLNTMYKILGGS
jgi:hypothetical protein